MMAEVFVNEVYIIPIYFNYYQAPAVHQSLGI